MVDLLIQLFAVLLLNVSNVFWLFDIFYCLYLQTENESFTFKISGFTVVHLGTDQVFPVSLRAFSFDFFFTVTCSRVGSCCGMTTVACSSSVVHL